MVSDRSETAATLEKAKARIAEREEANVDEAVRALLNTAIGRDFLWWLLRLGAWGTQPFHRDPVQMAFNCGELNCGQQVLDRILAVNPEGFVIMQKERLNDEHTITNAADSRDSSDDDSRVDA